MSVRPERPQDRVDLHNLSRQQPDLELVKHLLRQIETAGCHRQQDLQLKLARMIRDLEAPEAP